MVMAMRLHSGCSGAVSLVYLTYGLVRLVVDFVNPTLARKAVLPSSASNGYPVVELERYIDIIVTQSATSLDNRGRLPSSNRIRGWR